MNGCLTTVRNWTVGAFKHLLLPAFLRRHLTAGVLVALVRLVFFCCSWLRDLGGIWIVNGIPCEPLLPKNSNPSSLVSFLKSLGAEYPRGTERHAHCS